MDNNITINTQKEFDDMVGSNSSYVITDNIAYTNQIICDIDLYCRGNLTCWGNLECKGLLDCMRNLYCKGRLTCKRNLTCWGDLYCKSDLTCEKNLYCKGRLTCKRNLTCKGDLFWGLMSKPRVIGVFTHNRVLPPRWQREYWSERLGRPLVGCYDKIIKEILPDLDKILSDPKWSPTERWMLESLRGK